jgi:hypothetical protein
MECATAYRLKASAVFYLNGTVVSLPIMPWVMLMVALSSIHAGRLSIMQMVNQLSVTLMQHRAQNADAHGGLHNACSNTARMPQAWLPRNNHRPFWLL